ncbi:MULTISPECIES: DUF4625 domain-containing protein [unclassified Carboxylicivirga]|uniref:DUF4625 domain-containing protein n=1 Tax=Carboxylicivirga TaxID=1628153 RepID=UPI003D356375
MTRFLSVLLVVLTMAACGGGSDDKKEGPDTTAPTVSITSPTAGQAFEKSNGQTNVPFVAAFSDNKGLGKCTITIEYLDALPGSAQLKGFATPWKPAEEPKMEHTLQFNGEKTKEVNEAQLFGIPIEAACLSGNYRLTIVFNDNAEVPNEAIETIDIQIVSAQ